MSIPASSTTNLPQGLETVTIGSAPNNVTYIIDAVSGPSFTNRVISRTDAKGDRADFMVREGSDQIEVTYTLQRATTSTPLPPVGFGFTHNYDRSSATPSSFVVKDVTVNRDKDSFDTFEMTAIRKGYQS